MKIFLRLIVIVSAILQMSCTKDQPRVIIDVYSPEKSLGTTPTGTFDSSAVDLYLEGVYVGTTPFEFHQSDLLKYGLPEYEKVKISTTESWNTWDINSDGSASLAIASKDKHDLKRKLEFRARDGAATTSGRFNGFSTNVRADGAARILVRFTQESTNQNKPEMATPSKHPN